MEEIEARREARRKRILENSERRFLKITGRNDDAGKEYRSTNAASSQSLNSITYVQQNHIDESINDVIAENYDDGNRRVGNRDLCSADDNWNDSSLVLGSHKYDGITCSNNITRQAPRRRFQPGSYNAYDETYTDHLKDNSSILDNQKSNSTKAFLPSVLLSNRMNYILLAIIVNALLIMRLDHLFGKAIAIPYFTLTLGRLLVCDTKETSHDSLLVAALILCNIRPELTYKLKRFVTVLTIIFGGFALYIFSFTLIYCGISYCLPDTDSRIALNSAKGDL